MGVYDYRSIDSAPTDGTVVLVLRDQEPVPVVALFYDKTKSWKEWHGGKEIAPDYWCALPADPPSDYKKPPEPPKAEQKSAPAKKESKK